ncbi:MAG: zinc-dependent metalloprotease [Saprospiraceae bacterium]|nr:zinc-dependent metalloprotease [Saprospiraceae bacterium]
MKKVLFLLSFFLALWCSSAQAQVVAKAVESTALKYPANEVVSVLKRDGKYSNTEIKKDISESTYFDYNTLKARELIKRYPEFISLEIAINAKETYVLDLVSSAKAFEKLIITTSSGEKFDLSKFKAAHYRGVVRGHEEHTLVSISMFENEISGVIYSEHGNMVLGKVKETDKHILYKDSDLEKDLFPTCGMEDPPLNDEEADVYDSALSVIFNGMIDKCVELYFETEYDIYQAQGNTTTGVVTWVTNLFNNVSTLYANALIQTSISEIKVWNVPDPYNATSSSALLAQFQAQIVTLNGHLGQLLTSRSIGGGIAAGFDGLCNSNPDNSLSVSGHMTPTTPNVPSFSWNVQVVTHEFGHLFGSRHTHACVWNSNNTAIDGCAGGTEGNCPTPGIPSGGGTIMSYCHITNVGINFNNGFGLQPGNVMRMRVQNAACVSSCCDEDQSPNFTVAINCNNGWSVVATPGDQSPPNHWWGLYQTTVPGATSGGTLVASQTTPTANFQWLDQSKFYYIVHRIWADCYDTKSATVAVPTFAGNATASYTLEDVNGVVKDQYCVGEDIYLDGTASSNYDRFFLSAWKRPIGSPDPFTYHANYGWTFTSNIGIRNLTEMFLTSGESPGEVFAPGYEYEIQFAISSPLNCIPWIELTRRFTVTCCADFITADFKLNLVDNGNNFSLVAFDFEAYGTTTLHEWTVLSSPNPDGGPYTLVLETTTTGGGPITLYNQAVSGLYYFVVHRVSTLCGEFCYGKRRQGDNGEGQPEGGGDSGACMLCGEIDCSVLDNICFAPENEIAYCTSFPSNGVIFYWNPVQGATQYKVQIILNDYACCHSGPQNAPLTYTTTNNYLSLGGLSRYCFSWRIGVVCNGQTVWTEYHCFRGCDATEGEGPSIGLTVPGQGTTAAAATVQPQIYPNPANDELNVVLPLDAKADLIKVVDLQGKVVFEQRNPEQHLKIDSSKLIAGMYAIQVIYSDGSQAVEQIVITH